MYIDNEFKRLSKYIMDFSYNNPNEVEKIEILRKKFIKKYYNEIHSLDYQLMIKSLKDYLNGNWDVEYKGVSKYSRINDVISIYKSNISDYEKIYQISLLMTPNKLLNYVINIIVVGLNNSFIKDIVSLYYFMVKYEKDLSLIKTDYKYFEIYNGYKNNYSYAKFVIEMYIKSDSYKYDEFLEIIGIDDDIFKYCVNTVLELDNNLYQEYLVKKKQNNLCIINDIINRFEDIAFGINNGYFKDGVCFSLLEFFKRVPLKEEEGSKKLFTIFREYNKKLVPPPIYNFMKRVSYFVLAFMPEHYNTIVGFMLHNPNINNYSVKYPSDDFLSITHIIDDKEISDEIKNNVINYMRENDLPMIRGIYIEILNMHVKNGFDISVFGNRNVKEKCLLIP